MRVAWAGRIGRLVPGRLLFGAERIGKAARGTSRLQRFLLARIGSPAGEIDDLECRAHASVGERVAFAVKGFGPFERLALKRLARAREKHVAAAERADLAHQFARVGVGEGEGFGIGDGKREARALKQRAVIANVAEGRDPRARAALRLRLGFEESAAKLDQRAR